MARFTSSIDNFSTTSSTKLNAKVSFVIMINPNFLINWNGKEGKSQVPSLGWPAVRNRFSSSVVLILLEGNKQSLSDEILQIKGNTYPERCRQNQIRIRGFNPTYNLMHSSDSAEEALKEAELYFSKKELESFFCGEIGITFY